MSKKNITTDFDLLISCNIDIRGRTIYLDGEIDQDSTSLFIKSLRYLDKTPGEITIILNSDGGDVSSGFAIYDSIKLCNNEVKIKVLGSAMSVSSIILQAADKRIMTANSRMMIHVGDMEVEGHFKNVKRAVAENEAMDKICVDIYLEKIKEVKSSFTKSQIQKLMEFDTYLSAQRCLELGLIDEIAGEGE